MGECEHGVCVEFEGKRYALGPGNTEAFFRETVLPAVGGKA